MFNWILLGSFLGLAALVLPAMVGVAVAMYYGTTENW